MELFLGTKDGIVAAHKTDATWRVVRRSLPEQHVSSLVARDGVVLAGTTRGVFRSDDLGLTWHEANAGLEVRHVRWLAFHPQIPDRVFAGTEPAGIFVSTDGGATWSARPEVAAIRDQFRWYLPYSPEAGCVRGFALLGQRAYAAGEVGGVLRSDDGGITWRLASGSSGRPSFSHEAGQVHADVHSVAVHPSSPDILIAATGGGLFRSSDGGDTWQELYRCYCRAVWLDAGDQEHIIFGPAESVDRGGRVEETVDGGLTWHPANSGLTASWPRHMVERLSQIGGELYAVLSNGELLWAALPDLEWKTVNADAGWVNDVAAIL